MYAARWPGERSMRRRSSRSVMNRQGEQVESSAVACNVFPIQSRARIKCESCRAIGIGKEGMRLQNVSVWSLRFRM